MKIYVIEMWSGHSWQPTIDVTMKRATATTKKHEWQRRNPDDKFRVAAYIAVREKD